MLSLPLRPRCDVPPFKAIAAELSRRKASEPSERGRVLREAYQDYCSKAARPYAFRPFCQQFNLWEKRSVEEEIEAHKASESFWEGVAIPKSRVTAVSGELACFNVKGGALRIWDGF